MSLCESVCVCLPACPPACLSVYLSFCLSVFPSFCLSVCLSVRLPVSLYPPLPSLPPSLPLSLSHKGVIRGVARLFFCRRHAVLQRSGGPSAPCSVGFRGVSSAGELSPRSEVCTYATCMGLQHQHRPVKVKVFLETGHRAGIVCGPCGVSSI